MTGAASATVEWEGRALPYWQELLAVPELIMLESTRSTNDVAAMRAQHGAPAGLLVVADHQSAGRGQLARSWHAAPGTSLLFSFLLRPAGGTAPGVIPLRLGAVLARTLTAATGVEILLKWPNDLFIAGRKVGGILCEAVGAGSAGGHVVAGVGVNVRQQDHEWPAPLRHAAISLDSAAGTRHDRGLLLAAATRALRPLATAAADPLSPSELTLLARLDALRGRSIVVDDEPTSYIGAGVAADGALLLQQGRTIRKVISGSVRMREPSTN